MEYTRCSKIKYTGCSKIKYTGCGTMLVYTYCIHVWCVFSCDTIACPHTSPTPPTPTPTCPHASPTPLQPPLPAHTHLQQPCTHPYLPTRIPCLRTGNRGLSSRRDTPWSSADKRGPLGTNGGPFGIHAGGAQSAAHWVVQSAVGCPPRCCSVCNKHHVRHACLGVLLPTSRS